jgi:peptide/nickel transport system ATP-binding protein
MSDILLSARSLTRRWNRSAIPAVDNISLEVIAGECLALVGPSGCGKSTLAAMLLGLIRPDAGSVHFRERDLNALPPDELRRLRRHFQPVFQDARGTLDPRYSISDAILEPLVVNGLMPERPAQRVVELLAEVGLDAAIADRRPGEISGGQAQRVALARALSLDPELVICDESFSGLDASTQLQIIELLERRRQERGMTVLAISHDIALVSLMAERIAVMEQGRIVETGMTSDLLSAPQTAAARTLIEAVPKWPGQPVAN